MAGEMLGPILLSIHNLTYYQRLLAGARAAIESDGFAAYRAEKIRGGVDAAEVRPTELSRTCRHTGPSSTKPRIVDTTPCSLLPFASPPYGVRKIACRPSAVPLVACATRS